MATKSKKTPNKGAKVPVVKQFPYLYTGTELLNMQPNSIQFLWEPYIEKQGLVALAGSSDVGKSSFLRQLAIAIVLKKTSFLGNQLNVKHGRVIYFSTEDSLVSINRILRKQLPNAKPNDLEGLSYIFDAESPIRVIEEQLSHKNADAVIIDCFADVFDGQMNDGTSVRKFLKPYKALSTRFDCAFIFLHHTGKRTELISANKNNLVGSQSFEAKMRMVMELRKSSNSPSRFLWITKGNYVADSMKNEAMELHFDANQEFTFVGNKKLPSIDPTNARKFTEEDKANILKILDQPEFKNLSLDKKLERLKTLDIIKPPSKGTLNNWMKKSKPVQSPKKTKE